MIKITIIIYFLKIVTDLISNIFAYHLKTAKELPLQKNQMLLQGALLLSMLIQLGAAITAVSLIRRTRYNIRITSYNVCYTKLLRNLSDKNDTG